MNQTGLVCNTVLDLQLIRLASFNQILDPWVYILLRKELLWKIISGVKYICNRGQADLISLPQKQFDVESANCCMFCFHCLCDPPVTRQRSGSIFSQDSQYIRACPGRGNLNASSFSNLKSTSMTSLNGRQTVPLRVCSANDVHMLLLNNTLRKHGASKSSNTRFVDDIENDWGWHHTELPVSTSTISFIHKTYYFWILLWFVFFFKHMYHFIGHFVSCGSVYLNTVRFKYFYSIFSSCILCNYQFINIPKK